MVMKRKFVILSLICFMFALVGCGNEIPTLTEEDTVLVTHYAASLLLKYDEGYKTKVLNQEELEKEEALQLQIKEEAERLAAAEAEKEAKKQAEAAEKEKESSFAEVVSYTNPADFLGQEGFSVSYNGIEYLDQYPTDGDELFFAINASDHCKLAIIKLLVTNDSQEVKVFNALDTNARYKVSFNDGDYHSIMSTLLTDDFSVYKGEIQPGQSVETVLLAELKEEECVDVNACNLYIKYASDAIKIKLK